MDEFKYDSDVEKQFKVVEQIRAQYSDVPDLIDKDPTLSSHFLRKQLDPRIKFDSEFVSFQKKLGKKFEKQAKKFVADMETLRRECAANFELKKQQIAEINKDRMSELQRKNKEFNERHARVRKEYREFLDKRQKYLESHKNYTLGHKDWSQPSELQQEYLEFIEAKKAQIHQLRGAFDWSGLKQWEQQYVEQHAKKQEERDQKLIPTQKLNFQRNKKEFERVKTQEEEIIGKILHPHKVLEKQKQYSQLVRERYRPARSESVAEKFQQIQQELGSSIASLRERRQQGFINLSKGKDYLAYSRQIGMQSAQKVKTRPPLSQSLSLPHIKLNQSKTEPENQNPDYLGYNHTFTNPILTRKKLNLANNVFLSKPKNLEMNSLVKLKLNAEV